MRQLLFLLSISFCTILSYDYMPDDMSVSDGFTVIFHNSPQYNWLYGQQSGPKVSNIGQAVRQQWNDGMRGAKVNLHWRKQLPLEQQLRREIAQKNTAAAKLFNTVVDTQIGKALLDKVKDFTRQPTTFEEQPYIALCHEPDGNRNCLLSLFQKPGEPDKAEDYLRAVAQLLRENPQDIVLIFFEDYLDKGSPLNEMHKLTPDQKKALLHEMLIKSGIADYAHKLTSDHYSQGGKLPKKKLPTYGQMRKSGKRALLFTDVKAHAQDSPFLNYSKDGVFRTSHWSFDWIKDLGTSCRLHGPQVSHSFLVSHGPETSVPSSSPVAVIFRLLKKLGITVPKVQGTAIGPSNYAQINSSATIKKRVDDCLQEEPGGPVTVLSVDHGHQGQVKEAVRQINQERIKKHQQGSE